MKKTKPIILALCFLVLASCNKMCGRSRQDMTPEQVVEAYLDTSLNMTSIKQKEVLLNLTTGNLNSAIAASSDEVIEKAFINRHYHLDRYSIVERRDRTPRETEIVFELVYRNLGDKRDVALDSAPKITTENTVSVVREKGVWLIRDVLGKKTEIDFPMKDAQEVKPATEQEAAAERAAEQQAAAEAEKAAAELAKEQAAEQQQVQKEKKPRKK
jgi:hypothetical protein